MRTRRLGHSDIEVSVLGIGGNTFGAPRLDQKQSVQLIGEALDRGVSLVDTAFVYSGGESETFIGEAIASRRDEVAVATKFALRALEGRDPVAVIHEQVATSLRRLATDRVELLQVHAPSDEMDTDTLVATLSDLVEKGTIRSWGVSNYASWRLAETVASASWAGSPAPVTVQNQYNLLHRQPEQELLAACRRYGASLLPFHPLAGGFLSGKYRPGEAAPPGTRGASGSPIVGFMSTDRNWQVVAELEQFATEHGRTPVELAVAWLAAKPVVASVIAGVSNLTQLEQNIRGAEWELTPEQVALVDTITDSTANASAEDYRGLVGRT